MEEIKTRVCTKCGIEKDSSEFYKRKGYKDGLFSICKKCFRAYRRDYYDNNKDIYVKSNSIAYEKMKVSDKWSDMVIKKKEYDSLRRDENRQAGRRFREKHKDEIKEKRKEWASTCSLNYKIASILRGRIGRAIKNNRKNKATKSLSSVLLLGCSVSFLIDHLQSQFTEGMTWTNYGKNGWHIDHIVPCASFDLSDIENQKKCFHYTNLQPLWAADNLSKGAKIIIAA